MIGKARIPIIKFVEKTSGIAFDIRFTFVSFATEFRINKARIY